MCLLPRIVQSSRNLWVKNEQNCQFRHYFHSHPHVLYMVGGYSQVKGGACFQGGECSHAPLNETLHDSWNMHVTCRDLGRFTGQYHVRYMHGLQRIFHAMFHAWHLAHFMHMHMHIHAWCWHIPCMVQAYSMRGTGIFHAWYRRIPCVVQVYSMCGTGIFHAWCRCAFTMHGAGISMHALAVYSTGIYQISIHVPTDFVLATILVG